jgi:hypothetical protein
MPHAAPHERMNPFLRRAFESIRDLLASAGRAEVKTRHAVGVIVADVKRSRHKYGARAVAQLSEVLGTDEQTLYRCATVAECWTEPQLEALLGRTTTLGQPLSFSHFVLLASVPQTLRRAEMFERAVRDGLSVRRLALLLEPAPASKPDHRSDHALDRVVRTTEQLAHEIESVEHDLRSGHGAAPKLRAEVSTALEQATAAIERVRVLLDQQVAQSLTTDEPLPRRAGRAPSRMFIGME